MTIFSPAYYLGKKLYQRGSRLGRKAPIVEGKVLGTKNTDKEQAVQEHTDYANLAQEVYLKPDDRIKTFKGYTYNEKLSDDENAMYWNNDTRHALHVSRGSETKGDWLLTDPLLGIGLYDSTSRAKRDIKSHKALRERYGQYADYTNIGHSLGGTIARTLANKFNNHAVTYDKGSGIPSSSDYAAADSCHKNPNQKKCNQVHLRTKQDIVSMYPDHGQGTTTLDRGVKWHDKGSAHDLTHFGTVSHEELQREEDKKLYQDNYDKRLQEKELSQVAQREKTEQDIQIYRNNKYAENVSTS